MDAHKYPTTLIERHWLAPTVYAALALIILMVAAAGWSLLQQRMYRASILDALAVQNHIGDTFALVQDAESGQRGYLLSGSESYLDPYNAALPRIQDELTAIERLTADEPRHAESLEALREAVTAKLAELAASITLVRAGNRDAAMELVRSNAGVAAMLRVRKVIGEMRNAESRFLTEQFRLAAATRVRLGWFILVAGASALLLSLVAFVSLRRYTQTLLASSTALHEKNAALEDEIKARKSLQLQFQQLQKMDALGKLTGGIAHDFNNMLAVVMSALLILQRRLAKGERDIDQFVNAALDGIRKAAVLTGRLLAFSRQQPLDPSPVEVNRLVSRMSELLYRTLGEQIHIETVLAAGLWRARADISQLESSILNLAVNARDAMPDGGRLTIETANSFLDDAYARTHPDLTAGQYVMIALTDTGPGMTPEVLARAFDPFFTTKPVGKGTGLGLSQVYGFVKQLEGHIQLYSEIGQGTTVKLYLPKAVGTTIPVAIDPGVVTPGGTPATVVLVLEDEPSVRRMTVASLQELGYTVIHAGAPGEALGLLASHPTVHLIFTDVVMPEMNGRQFVEAALKTHPSVRVLYTTGYTQNAIVHNGVLDEGTDLLMKPFTLEALAAKVHAVLSRPVPATQ